MTERQRKLAEICRLTEVLENKKLTAEERIDIVENAIIEIAEVVFGGADND